MDPGHRLLLLGKSPNASHSHNRVKRNSHYLDIVQPQPKVALRLALKNSHRQGMPHPVQKPAHPSHPNECKPAHHRPKSPASHPRNHISQSLFHQIQQ